jgi:hypothetical protein
MDTRTFQLLTRDQIDVEKWNQAVTRSPAPVYLYSWFFDAMKAGWVALVAIKQGGDYASIFPIQVQRKFGIAFIRQNPFFPCNGVYTIIGKDGTHFQQFVGRSLQTFSYVQRLICRQHYFPAISTCEQKMVLNYRLEIQPDFNQHRMRFSSNRKRNLRTALLSNLTFCENADIHAYIRFHDEFLSRKLPGFKRRQYAELAALFAAAHERRKSAITWIFQNNQPVATAILLFEKDTITYFSAATSHNGRRLGASTYLICEVLRKYSGKYRHFDFNGGWDVPSLNQFYAGFGATPEQLAIVSRVAFPEPFRTLFLFRRKLIRALQNLKLGIPHQSIGRDLNTHHSNPSS